MPRSLVTRVRDATPVECVVGLAGLKPVSIPLLARVGAARSDVQRPAGLGTRVRSPAPSLAELCGRTPNRTGLSCRREHCCAGGARRFDTGLPPPRWPRALCGV